MQILVFEYLQFAYLCASVNVPARECVRALLSGVKSYEPSGPLLPELISVSVA